ncbi:hypothetical protein [Dapis sp. BLCC M172]|uniref:hypothetical protein n=1 Tax=Dapis sp. BLCC M172 TaxID=2975281 RepID=UPI003CF63AC3
MNNFFIINLWKEAKNIQKVDFEIELPEIERIRNLPIHEEYFWFKENGTKRKLRLHDYIEN